MSSASILCWAILEYSLAGGWLTTGETDQNHKKFSDGLPAENIE